MTLLYCNTLLCFTFLCPLPPTLTLLPRFCPSSPACVSCSSCPSLPEQTSGCACGPSTRSTTRRCEAACPRTSSSPSSASSSSSAGPVQCCAPVTSAPSSATSSSRSWPTSTLSGPTTWAGRFWKRSRASSSPIPWREPRATRACGSWSVWTRMITKRAEGCF